MPSQKEVITETNSASNISEFYTFPGCFCFFFLVLPWGVGAREEKEKGKQVETNHSHDNVIARLSTAELLAFGRNTCNSSDPCTFNWIPNLL